MARTFTCKDCGSEGEATSNTGRFPLRCEKCRPERQVKTEADISPIFSARTQGVLTVRKPTTASVEHQERAMRALAMRRDRKTWEQIAQACGYRDRAAAYGAAKQEMARRQVEINETIDELRQAELAHLEMLSDKALEVMHKAHVVIQGGKVVVSGPEGQEQAMLDDGPTLAAVATLIKVSESRRKLLGLDAASKAEVSTQIQFTVQGVAEGEMP